MFKILIDGSMQAGLKLENGVWVICAELLHN